MIVVDHWLICVVEYTISLLIYNVSLSKFYALKILVLFQRYKEMHGYLFENKKNSFFLFHISYVQNVIL